MGVWEFLGTGMRFEKFRGLPGLKVETGGTCTLVRGGPSLRHGTVIQRPLDLTLNKGKGKGPKDLQLFFSSQAPLSFLANMVRCMRAATSRT